MRRPRLLSIRVRGPGPAGALRGRALSRRGQAGRDLPQEPAADGALIGRHFGALRRRSVRGREAELVPGQMTETLARRACARPLAPCPFPLPISRPALLAGTARARLGLRGRTRLGLRGARLLFSGLAQDPSAGAFVPTPRPGWERGGRGRPRARTHRQPSRIGRRHSLIRLPSGGLALNRKGCLTPFCTS